MTVNVDPAEIAKFSELAHRWWDPSSEFRPLHEINPLRLDYIDRQSRLAGKEVLDIGCGGGILAEAMVDRGARVSGIDMSERALKVAQLHLLESGRSVDYRLVSAEALAAEAPGRYDIVTCMELLEHVPDPASTVGACARLLRPGGAVYFSTISRNPKAYLYAILGAEYVLKLLPRGTHDYAKFIRPSELAGMCRGNGLEVADMVGMTYSPVTQRYALSWDTSVNYIMHCRGEQASQP
jgi:2-polyprenyl-6-hydroxyphenyl methylase/3-demethylubiquinone-9 3-methyltransferase